MMLSIHCNAGFPGYLTSEQIVKDLTRRRGLLGGAPEAKAIHPSLRLCKTGKGHILRSLRSSPRLKRSTELPSVKITKVHVLS